MGEVEGGWAGTPEPCTSPLTSRLVAAPAPAEGACTSHGAKIARGWESSRAVHTVAPPGTTSRNQVKLQLLLRLLRERAPHMEPRLQEAGSPAELCTQWHRLVQQAETRWRLLEQLVPAAQSFETACKALLVQLSPSEQLLAELQLGPKCPEESLQDFQEVCEGVVARAKDLERVLETGWRLAELLTIPLQCQCFLSGLLPLAADDQAQLVWLQLDHFQERVRLTELQVARAQQKLLSAQRTVSSKSSPPAGLEAQLELEGSAPAHPGLKDQKQVFVPP
ncbi:cDNA sequence BC024139 [Cricetulus griseus]